MDIEYYVFDKMNVQSEKVEVAIEIMRSLIMYKDLFKDSNNYFLYSLKYSQKEFKENKDVWNLMETHGMDILPIVCIDKKIYKTKDVLSVEEMEALTNSAISYQIDDTSSCKESHIHHDQMQKRPIIKGKESCKHSGSREATNEEIIVNFHKHGAAGRVLK